MSMDPVSSTAATDAGADSVDTLAGPGFCTGSATPELGSRAVRALAVDHQGRLFFDTGLPEAGLVTRVDRDGRTKVLATGIPGAPSVFDARAANSLPASAGRLAPDGTGGILVTAGSKIVHLDSEGGLTTVAGDPASAIGERGPISSGDGGPASEARFISARSLSSDESGNLYVAEEIDQRAGTLRIRFINRSDHEVTFYSGTPHSITVASGKIDTIAGAQGQTGSGDGGPARLATLQGAPPALTVNGMRLYVASSWAVPRSREEAAAVRLVNLGDAPIDAHGILVTPGNIETVAGGGPVGYGGDGGPARLGAFSYLPGIATDGEGNLFLADQSSQRIRRVDASGVISTFAGTGGSRPQDGGFNGNDKPAVEARLDRPYDVKVGRGGNIYVSDQNNGQVRVIDGAGVIRAAPGSGTALSWSCGPDSRGQKKSATTPERPRPGAPAAVAVDAKGNVYFVTADTQQVKRLLPSGIVETVVGTTGGQMACQPEQSCQSTGDEGKSAREASLRRPTALAVSPRGDLYIFDAGSRQVRFVNLGSSPVTVHGVTVASGTIRTVVGNGTAGGGGDGGKASEAQLGELRFQSAGLLSQLVFLGPSLGSLAIDGQGDLFIADSINHRVRQVNASGTITTFAGEGAATPRDGCCRDPAALALDASGNLLVSDLSIDPGFVSHPRVWLINRNELSITLAGQTVPAGAVTPIAGNGTLGFGGDGNRAVDAQLLTPMGMSLDSTGNLYILEVGDSNVDARQQYIGRTGSVRKVDPAGTIHLAAGNGRGGFNGDGLKGRLTSLNSPSSVAVDGCGNVLIADLGNDRLRRLNLTASCQPVSQRQEKPAGKDAGRNLVMGVLLAVVGASVGGLAMWWIRRRSRPMADV
jgi:sugar lactone lactonase YvrE